MRKALGVGVASTVLLLSACGDLSAPPARTREQHPVTTTALPDDERYGGSANFVVNPSFETGLQGWSPWTGASVVQIVHRDSKFGRASALVRASEASPYGIQLPGPVANPTRGDTFELSAWIRSADRRKRLTLILLANGPGSGVETIRKTLVTVDTTWQRVRMRGRLRGSSRQSVSLFLGQLRSIGAGDGFFVDGVSLVLISP